LEFNDFASLSSLAPLASITTLRNLLLKGNRISTFCAPSSSPSQPPIFGPNLHYLDLSYNAITTWSFIDALPSCFPALTSLRLTHNPLYSDPDLDDTTATAGPITTSQSHTQSGGGGLSKTDESYMLTLARLPRLKALNFSAVTPADRADAEMFYLSRIARQLAAVPEGSVEAEREVLKRHPRWEELCRVYGEPVVVRRGEVDPGFLEARLVKVDFYLEGKVVQVQVPKSFDIYAVKGLVGRVFGLSPLKVKLVWETGEGDPVGGFDEVDEDGEEEDLEAEWERREGEGGVPGDMPELERKGARWVKREVELKDGPRQFGYCVDGLEARIRVERR
jgi:hypothetical protein